MKRILHLSYVLIFSILASCSGDSDVFDDPVQENPEETPQNQPETPENPESPEETQGYYPTPAETSSYMVDANATAETVALFYNLKGNSQNHIVIGQQDAFNAFYENNNGESDMMKLTGSDPALLGSDFMFITDDNNDETSSNWFYQQELQITGDAVEAYNKGMVNIFCWHFREPYEGQDFYTSELTDFQKYNAFASLLPGGTNHDYYKTKLDKIAQVAKNMVGNDGKLVPFIFRPFHEFDGDFFWWGAPYCTPEQFKTLWQFTVEYLRDDLDVHNILYAYAPDNSYITKAAYLERYPGDDYVDVLGMDNYGDLYAQDGSGVQLANDKLKNVSDLALEKVKISALSETGFFVDANTTLASDFYSNNLYKVLTNNGIKVGFMMFWQNSNSSYTVPVPGVAGAADFMTFIEKDEPQLLNSLPDMYSMPN